MTETLLIVAAAMPAVAAGLIGLLRPDGDTAGRWAVRAAVVAALAAIGVAILVATGGAVEAVIPGAGDSPLMGLHADRVGAVLALLTTTVGLVVQSFARRALDGDVRARRFFVLTALLTSATTTVALATTLGLLVVSWIAAGASLAALVAHRSEWQPAARAARRTRRSLLVGDSALVAVAVLVIASVGDLDLRSSQAAAESLAGAWSGGPFGGLLPVVAVLVTVAGVSRSALVPLHRWLPATLAGPTPVSALLHAGVVNGAGVLLVRLAPLFGASSVATHLAFTAGVVTTTYATAVMLVRTDVKGNLAWSTAGQMGFMAVQLSVGAFAAALFHMIGHGLYKAALFLGSGGAVTAHLRHHHRPEPRPRTAPVVRLFMATLVPAGALVAANEVLDPQMSAAKAILVGAFAWATAARAADGWLRAAPFSAAPTAALAAVGTVVGVFAYIGGLMLFEGFVGVALPSEVPAAVDATVLAVTLAAVGCVAVGVWLVPGPSGERLRSRVYVWLLSTSTPVLTSWWRPAGSGSGRHETPSTSVPTGPGHGADRAAGSRP